jgi:hypothetical protein
MNNGNDDLLNQIKKLQNEYYATNNKNVFFKNMQKFDCASTIASHIDIEKLLQGCVFIIPNTNKIYIDYNVLKTFLEPSTYKRCVDYFIHLIEIVVKQYGSFESHTNMNSLTMSALQRYTEVIKIFLAECLTRETAFAKVNVKTVIYNFPNSFDHIYKILLPFIDPVVRAKTFIYTKSTSETHLNELFSNK